MKWIAEKRAVYSRMVGVSLGRKIEYNEATDTCGWMFQIAFGLWFWAIGWKSEWRSK
jgi:hypothetical protein